MEIFLTFLVKMLRFLVAFVLWFPGRNVMIVSEVKYCSEFSTTSVRV